MKWTSATALFLVAGAVGVGAFVVVTREPKAPVDVLTDVRERMGDPLFDRADAITQLDRVLDGGRQAADPDVRLQLLETRSEIYKELEVYQRAREDLERIEASSGNVPPELLLEIAGLMELEGLPAEALQRTRSLTERFPRFGDGWFLRGKLEERVAFDAIEVARDIADQRLASDSARLAQDMIVELAARHARDPRRADLEFRLSELFRGMRESDLDQIMTEINEPRTAFMRARSVYAKALELTADPELLTRLARSFDRAGRGDLAIRLQFAARSFEDVAADPGSVAELLGYLFDAGRIVESRALLLDWDWQRGGTLEFYRSAGEVLYKAGDYAALERVAQGLRLAGAETGIHWAKFFAVVSPAYRTPEKANLAGLRQHLRNLRPGLMDFIKDDNYPEPFLGARNDARFLDAQLVKAVDDVALERISLSRALEEDPNGSAEAWARYAETMRQAKRVQPWAEIEIALTKAIDLQPSNTALLEPFWYEAGEKALEKRGLNLEGIFAWVARHGTALPVQEIGPAVKTRLAQEHLRVGRLYDAISVANDVRASYPDLVPPLDVLIAAKLADERRAPESAAADIVERIEAAGIDDRIEEFLAQLTGGTLPGKWLVRAMRSAPARFGKSAVARYYLARGEVDRAGVALKGVDQASAPLDLRLLRTEQLIEKGSFAAALAELDLVDDAPRVSAKTHVLRLRALLGAGASDGLNVAVRRMLATTPTTAPVLLDAVDILLDGGRPRLAYAVVEHLDADPEARTPEFYRRRLVVDLVLAEALGLAVPRESQLRAEPYLTDGTPQLAALLLAVDQRDWVALRPLVEELRASSFEPTPLQDVCLSLLGERLEVGLRNAQRGSDAMPRSAEWALVAAAARSIVGAEIDLPAWFGPGASEDLKRTLDGTERGVPRDPRDVVALLLVVRDPLWNSYVQIALSKLRVDAGSSIWSRWLALHYARIAGDTERAGVVVEALLGDHPRFGPGHDAAVALAVERFPAEPLHPSVVAARTRRVGSMTAKLVDDPIDVRIAVAGDAARQGKYAFAAQEMRSVILEESSRAAEGRLMLSIFELRSGQPDLAAKRLQEALAEDLGVYREVGIDTLIYALETAVARHDPEAAPPVAGALSPEEALAIIDDVALTHANDPLVLLQRLRLQGVSQGEQGERARGILRTLRTAAAGEPLDSLRDGSTAKWVRYLTPIASDVAAELVEEQLVLAPGNALLLQLSGEVARVQGRTKDARADFETLLAIEPQAETGYALAELMIEEGASPAEIRQVLRQAGQLEGGASARATYLSSIDDLRRARPRLDDIVPRLRTLWQQRASSRDQVDPLELGLTFTDALVRRGTKSDLEEVLQVIEQAQPLAVRTLYERNYLTALGGMVEQLLAEL